jgi:hypothetical protein
MMLFLAAGAAVLSEPLDSLLAAAHRADRGHAADQFAGAETPSAPQGTPFTAIIDFHDGRRAGGTGSSAYYTYDGGELRLTFFVARSLARLRSVDTPGREYVGQNAFGARARVSVSRKTEDALLFETSPIGDSIVETYETSVALPPAQARAAARDARVIVTGTIGGTTGKNVGCDSDFYSPTVDAPAEVTVDTCWVRVHTQRIAIFRKSTGAVLREWRVKSSGE